MPSLAADVYLRLRRSTNNDAASADIAAMTNPLNSGTGTLLYSKYMLYPVPVCSEDTATLHVCEAKPGLNLN